MAKVNKITGRVVKKKTVRSARRTGTAGAPLDKGFDAVKYYFHNEVDKKEGAECIKNYVKKTYSKEDQKIIFANPEYNFTMFSHYQAACFWLNTGMKPEDMYVKTGGPWIDSLGKWINKLIETGVPLLAEKEAAKKLAGNVVILSPMQRLAKKVHETIMYELDDMEDLWIEGEDASIDLYTRMKFHALGGSATKIPQEKIEGWLLDFGDAYHKRCEQAVEGYAHVSRKELKRRITLCELMLSDLDKIRSSTKASKTIKIKKPASLEKQIARLKFKKEDNEYKITSITPALIIGAMRIYTFNTKYKQITEYVTENPRGFEVSGSTLKGLNSSLSRQVSLRKPDEFIPIALKKSIKQIDDAWQKLTTKTKVPNGRINGDTIILRVMDK